ncbi:MAG TPA: hypothetical protein VH561_12425 [Micromonosporaceae bacterium]
MPRVEVACRGGRGRTGTALAALSILDGLAPRAALAWLRRTYDPGAVETPWQRWWLCRVRAEGPPAARMSGMSMDAVRVRDRRCRIRWVLRMPSYLGHRRGDGIYRPGKDVV